MKFPIRIIQQIEMTSRCNLRCRYCVHPKMPRAKMDMTDEHYKLALGWARTFTQRGTQQELNLAGIGESTIHPEFVRNVHWAREAVGPNVRIVITTNGLAVTEEMVRAIEPAKPRVFVSLHRPEKAGPAIELFKRYNMIDGASADPSVAAINWAGQVEWFNSATKRICTWGRDGRVMVMADGRITRCCLDGSGAGIIGHISQTLDMLSTGAYVLCKTCDQSISHVATPEEMDFDARNTVAFKGIPIHAAVA